MIRPRRWTPSPCAAEFGLWGFENFSAGGSNSQPDTPTGPGGQVRRAARINPGLLHEITPFLLGSDPPFQSGLRMRNTCTSPLAKRERGPAGRTVDFEHQEHRAARHRETVGSPALRQRSAPARLLASTAAASTTAVIVELARFPIPGRAANDRWTGPPLSFMALPEPCLAFPSRLQRNGCEDVANVGRQLATDARMRSGAESWWGSNRRLNAPARAAWRSASGFVPDAVRSSLCSASTNSDAALSRISDRNESR
jgi:hypothetical protein